MPEDKVSKNEVLQGSEVHDQWGHVDESGNIVRDDDLSKGEVIIGKTKKDYALEALYSYKEKFKELEKNIEKLKEKIEKSADKTAYYKKVKAMIQLMPNFKGIGNFSKLYNTLAELKVDIEVELKKNSEKLLTICLESEKILAICTHNPEDDQSSHDASDHKPEEVQGMNVDSTGNKIHEEGENDRCPFVDWYKASDAMRTLRKEFESVGNVPPDKKNQLKERFEKAEGDFLYEKKRYFNDLNNMKEERIRHKERIIQELNDLSCTDNWRESSEKAKRLMDIWKSSGSMPAEKSNELWEKYCKALTRFYEKRAEHYE